MGNKPLRTAKIIASHDQLSAFNFSTPVASGPGVVTTWRYLGRPFWVWGGHDFLTFFLLSTCRFQYVDLPIQACTQRIRAIYWYVTCATQSIKQNVSQSEKQSNISRSFKPTWGLPDPSTIKTPSRFVDHGDLSRFFWSEATQNICLPFARLFAMAGLFGSLNEILGLQTLSQSFDAHSGWNSIANMLLLSCRGLSPPRVDISVLFCVAVGNLGVPKIWNIPVLQMWCSTVEIYERWLQPHLRNLFGVIDQILEGWK